MAGALVEHKLITLQNQVGLIDSRAKDTVKNHELRDILTIFSFFFILFEIAFLTLSFAIKFSPLNHLPDWAANLLWDLRIFISAGTAALIYSVITNSIKPRLTSLNPEYAAVRTPLEGTN
ncbi:MAG: hypothetical protein M1421_03215 [Candidatus Eremiobacteraeota bacterium]|nr:hypothetical protein [Candidatus Eremiobacteraeota bacterium]